MNWTEDNGLANKNDFILEEFARCLIVLIGMQFVVHVRPTLTLKLANIKMTGMLFVCVYGQLDTHIHTHFFDVSELNGLKNICKSLLSAVLYNHSASCKYIFLLLFFSLAT